MYLLYLRSYVNPFEVAVYTSYTRASAWVCVVMEFVSALQNGFDDSKPSLFGLAPTKSERKVD